jgi:DNA-binding transcriptional ArsR family regulator
MKRYNSAHGVGLFPLQKTSFKDFFSMAFHSADASVDPSIERFIDQFLNTICNTSRRRILEYLSNPSDSTSSLPERSVGEIAEHLGLAISTTSEHLKQLRSMRLLVTRKEGKKTYYRLHNHELVQAFQDLIHFLETHYQQNVLLPSESKETS